MPYPFARAPRTDEFVSRLVELGAELLVIPGTVTGPWGSVTIRYLKREANGQPTFSEPLAENDSDLVGWDKLRRICHQLKIDPRELKIPGLHLG